MKKISEVHFERMNMMCRMFESNSKNDKLYLPPDGASMSKPRLPLVSSRVAVRVN